jgi:hypothetical protein
MDVRQYWADVTAKIAEIANHYPDGLVHIISRHNREKNTTAGAISTASLQLAAECLVNNTHDLASPEQIATYAKNQIEKRRQIQLHERSKKQEFVMVVDRQEAETKGIPMPLGSEEPREKAKPVTNKVA